MHPLLIAHVRSVAAAAVESGQAFTRYKAHNTRHVQGEAAIMQEILVSGPVMQEILVSGPVDVTFNVYSDFQPYCSEGESPCPVYQKKAGGWEGLHSVKMIGWGQLNATAYWLVQNSWGSDWGEAGDGPSARCVLFASVEMNLFLLQPSHVTRLLLPYPARQRRVRYRIACPRRRCRSLITANSHL